MCLLGLLQRSQEGPKLDVVKNLIKILITQFLGVQQLVKLRGYLPVGITGREQGLFVCQGNIIQPVEGQPIGVIVGWVRTHQGRPVSGSVRVLVVVGVSQVHPDLLTGSGHTKGGKSVGVGQVRPDLLTDPTALEPTGRRGGRRHIQQTTIHRRGGQAIGVQDSRIGGILVHARRHRGVVRCGLQQGALCRA